MNNPLVWEEGDDERGVFNDILADPAFAAPKRSFEDIQSESVSFQDQFLNEPMFSQSIASEKLSQLNAQNQAQALQNSNSGSIHQNSAVSSGLLNSRHIVSQSGKALFTPSPMFQGRRDGAMLNGNSPAVSARRQNYNSPGRSPQQLLSPQSFLARQMLRNQNKLTEALKADSLTSPQLATSTLMNLTPETPNSSLVDRRSQSSLNISPGLFQMQQRSLAQLLQQQQHQQNQLLQTAHQQNSAVRGGLFNVANTMNHMFGNGVADFPGLQQQQQQQQQHPQNNRKRAMVAQSPLNMSRQRDARQAAKHDTLHSLMQMALPKSQGDLALQQEARTQPATDRRLYDEYAHILAQQPVHHYNTPSLNTSRPNKRMRKAEQSFESMSLDDRSSSTYIMPQPTAQAPLVTTPAMPFKPFTVADHTKPNPFVGFKDVADPSDPSALFHQSQPLTANVFGMLPAQTAAMPSADEKGKKYHCNFCQKSFAGRVGLVRHLRVHTGEKPFQCKVCGRSFKQKGTLTSHERIHTGEMPFACDMCGTKFRHNGNLRRHQRTCKGRKK